jgi:hypothetical protein
MTVHHWRDLGQGVAELKRVADRQVIFTWDTSLGEGFWFHAEYLPELEAWATTARETFGRLMDLLDVQRVEVVPLPRDCTDGFQEALWARPEWFLEPEVRRASSAFAFLDPAVIDAAVGRLAADLADGSWYERHADLLERSSMDLGCRLIVAGR